MEIMIYNATTVKYNDNVFVIETQQLDKTKTTHIRDKNTVDFVMIQVGWRWKIMAMMEMGYKK